MKLWHQGWVAPSGALRARDECLALNVKGHVSCVGEKESERSILERSPQKCWETHPLRTKTEGLGGS